MDGAVSVFCDICGNCSQWAAKGGASEEDTLNSTSGQWVFCEECEFYLCPACSARKGPRPRSPYAEEDEVCTHELEELHFSRAPTVNTCSVSGQPLWLPLIKSVVKQLEFKLEVSQDDDKSRVFMVMDNASMRQRIPRLLPHTRVSRFPGMSNLCDKAGSTLASTGLPCN
jgi:hypothetical protein